MSIENSRSATRGLPSAVEWAHRVIEERVQAGSWVVDATVGNGHDTLFLAKLVGSSGLVFGFDIQEHALEMARQRLDGAGVEEARCTLMCTSHEFLTDNLPQEWRGRVQAVMFNLGYLPGADKTVITQTGPTLRAIRSALNWLAIGGVMTVVVYPGHPGGDEEAEAVRRLGASLPSAVVEVQQLRPVNRSAPPPECWVFLKRAEATS